ncbi:HVO_0416 family zinc finger protein [Halarchaeum salinum]|uniref:Small CPxCG-related zinc finger protein n=1 Tax=Halarchaeum salinum TaxID=489912 RepID=A0AAV3S5S0_9EURY
MSTARDTDAVLDEYLEHNDHDVEGWDRSYNKKQCPDCGGLHETAARECTVCGWSP